MQTLLQDLRYSLRVLRKTPGFTSVAVFVLALGIGVNTAMFSVLNAVLLRPLLGGGDVVGVYSRERAAPRAYRAFSYPNYRDILGGGEVFSAVAAQQVAMVGVGDAADTRRVFAGVVSATYFATLDVHVAMGRAFLPREEDASAPPVVILGYEYWKKHGGDPRVIGSSMTINARPFTVVGVAPRGFTGTMALLAPELWLPLGTYEIVVNDVFRRVGSRLHDRENHSLLLAGRLKPGLTAASAAPLLAALSARMERAYPAENRNQELLVHPLSRLNMSAHPSNDGEVTTVLVFLLAMSGIVLLIACLNLANLLLARGKARRREMAIRVAVGGGRWRLVRQLLTEAGVLSIVGGGAAIVLAMAGTRAMAATLVPVLPLALSFDAAPDIRVLIATLGFCLLSTLFFGLGPALTLSRADVLPDLKEQPGDIRGSGRGRWFVMRNMLVVGQMALSLTLVTAAGLFIKGALGAANADPGFRLEREALASVDASLAGYDEARGRAAYRSVMTRLRAAPAVEAASLASSVPFGEFSDSRTVRALGRRRDEVEHTSFTLIGADYFATLGLRLLRGREFSQVEEERPSAVRPVVVNATLARRLWADENPIGQRLQVQDDAGAWGDPMEVVGVAPGLRGSLFDREAYQHLYVPFGGQYQAGMNLHVRGRSEGDAAERVLLHALHGEIRAADACLPVLGVKSLREHRDTSIFVWIARSGADMFSTFGIAALLLAVIGLYGVKAYMVSRRTREIGIRMALGAAPRDVLSLVMREGFALTMMGLGIGLALSALIAPLLSSWVYGVAAFEPVVFASAPLVLAAAALAACYLPARRATRVAPVTALRCD